MFLSDCFPEIGTNIYYSFFVIIFCYRWEYFNLIKMTYLPMFGLDKIFKKETTKKNLIQIQVLLELELLSVKL